MGGRRAKKKETEKQSTQPPSSFLCVTSEGKIVSWWTPRRYADVRNKRRKKTGTVRSTATSREKNSTARARATRSPARSSSSCCSGLGMRSMAQRISTTRTNACAPRSAHGWGLRRHFRPPPRLGDVIAEQMPVVPARAFAASLEFCSRPRAVGKEGEEGGFRETRRGRETRGGRRCQRRAAVEARS